MSYNRNYIRTHKGAKKIIVPTIKDKDREYYRIANRLGDYSLRSNDPILDELISGNNVSELQSQISKIILDRYNIHIPPQDYTDIQEALEHEYNRSTEVVSSIQFYRSADVLRRVFDGRPWKKVDINSELGRPHKKNKMSIKKLIKDINERALHRLIRHVEAAINRRLRYEQELKRSYQDKIHKLNLNKYKRPVVIKERAKYMGDDHVDFKINSIRRYVKPGFTDTFSNIKRRKKPKNIVLF